MPRQLKLVRPVTTTISKIRSQILWALCTPLLIVAQDRNDTLKVKASTQNPHGVISIACDACHATGAWTTMKKDMTFDHNTQTDFPLEGQHRSGDCKACHSDYVFTGAKTACYQCHHDVHTGQLGKDCGQCHSSKSWQPFNFKARHDMTRFPLIGKHATTDCQSCHKNQQKDEYRGLTIVCSGCHLADYTAATNPNHVQSQFPTTCDVCHTPQGWTPALFVDHTQFGFPLTLGHSRVACSACHVNGNFSTVTTDCYSCHKADYDRTNDPPHLTGQYPTRCVQCHSTNPGWTPANFDHSSTRFPLTGAHLAAQSQCVQCHASGFANTPILCYSCHQNDYSRSQNPNHVAGNFSTACDQCHSTNAGWKPASFDHSATQFPLTGAHLSIAGQCLSCHASGFTNTPTACYACHQTAYTQAADPNHPGLAFPTSCQDRCHNTTAWQPSIFNHGSYTGYPLQGAHQTIGNQCVKCHTGNLTSAATLCYSCHQADYNNTTTPNHTTSNFPHDCQSCHSQSVWIPWTVNHDAQYFPINSGKHKSQWTGCGGGSGDGAGCHTDNTNYTTYSCVHCHEHSASQMNDSHRGVSGYAFSSQACFNCHPTGTSSRIRPRRSNR